MIGNIKDLFSALGIDAPASPPSEMSFDFVDGIGMIKFCDPQKGFVSYHRAFLKDGTCIPFDPETLDPDIKRQIINKMVKAKIPQNRIKSLLNITHSGEISVAHYHRNKVTES